MMKKKILIVEDEIKLAELLSDYLKQSDMEPHLVHDGAKVIDAIQSLQPELILLDLMLPNKDGISLCKEIRQHQSMSNIPIIMATAKVDEIDRLLGLEIGADDYICKPYSPREVVARVKAVLRRYQQTDNQEAIALDLQHEQMKAILFGEDLKLTAVEYSLLKLMAENPGKIFSRSQLMDSMYKDYRVVSERTIDSHIKKLRKKVADISPDYALIHSVYGVGYKVEYE